VARPLARSIESSYRRDVRIVVFGAAGQVGAELVRQFATFAEVVALTRDHVDLADLDALRQAVSAAEPQIIINAAAYNAVDAAETDEEQATLVNGTAVGVLGEEANRRQALLIHYSTDFVFDGRASQPYLETDAPSPLSAYGRSKLAGEQALLQQEAPALIFRTSWVYGLRRASFVRTMLRLARSKETLRVVDDQVGCPTAAHELALATSLVLFGARRDPFAELSPLRGLYHLAGGGHCSRLELARAAIELDPLRDEHRVQQVLPTSSAELAMAAQRPAFAPLDCNKARDVLGVALPPWRETLARVLSDRDTSP
jgi:dTDP-4-dehydrorhamnose reductase